MKKSAIMKSHTIFFYLRFCLLFASVFSHVGASASTLETVRMNGSIKVCADPSNLPMSHADLNPAGYDLEIAAEIAKTLGVKLEYYWFATNYGRRAIKQLADGKCDFFMGLPTEKSFEEATPSVTLSKPYYSGSFSLIIRKQSDAKGLQDLAGKQIGVEMMTVADFFLFHEGYARGLYRNQKEIFEAVSKGEIEAGLMWAPVAGWLAKNNPESGARIISASRHELLFSLAIGVKAEDQDLKLEIDNAIDDINRRGKGRKILQRYGVPALTSDIGLSNAEPPILLAMGGTAPSGNSEAMIAAGRSLYLQTCAKCHGPGAISGGTIPDLRKFEGSDQDYLNTVRDGRQGTIMPAWKEFLTDEEILKIRAYTKSVSIS